jgi:hypothetical protein
VRRSSREAGKVLMCKLSGESSKLSGLVASGSETKYVVRCFILDEVDADGVVAIVN